MSISAPFSGESQTLGDKNTWDTAIWNTKKLAASDEPAVSFIIAWEWRPTKTTTMIPLPRLSRSPKRPNGTTRTKKRNNPKYTYKHCQDDNQHCELHGPKKGHSTGEY